MIDFLRFAPHNSDLAPLQNKKKPKGTSSIPPIRKLEENSHVPFDLLEEIAKKKERAPPAPLERFTVKQLTGI